MEIDTAIKPLSAIAHEGRLALLRQLIQAGPEGMNAGALAQFAEVNATTASAQLLVLSNAGLVNSSRQGREVIYVANYNAMRELLGFLMKDCCGNRADICADLSKGCC